MAIQVALANYSTEAVQTELHLWFSTDTSWSFLADVASTGTFRQSVGKGNSALLAHGFTVPGGLAARTSYRPIAQVDSWFDLDGDGVKDTAKSTTDWTPRRGAVSTC